jgi:hypothetical protein
MSSRDFSVMLEDLARAGSQDFARMLASLQTDATDGFDVVDGIDPDQSFAAEAFSVYQETMEIYGPAAEIYESTIQVLHPAEMGSFTTTTNR